MPKKSLKTRNKMSAEPLGQGYFKVVFDSDKSRIAYFGIDQIRLRHILKGVSPSTAASIEEAYASSSALK
jgi:hypothetical protein